MWMGKLLFTQNHSLKDNWIIIICLLRRIKCMQVVLLLLYYLLYFYFKWICISVFLYDLLSPPKKVGPEILPACLSSMFDLYIKTCLNIQFQSRKSITTICYILAQTSIRLSRGQFCCSSTATRLGFSQKLLWLNSRSCHQPLTLPYLVHTVVK